MFCCAQVRLTRGVSDEPPLLELSRFLVQFYQEIAHCCAFTPLHTRVKVRTSELREEAKLLFCILVRIQCYLHDTSLFMAMKNCLHFPPKIIFCFDFFCSLKAKTLQSQQCHRTGVFHFLLWYSHHLTTSSAPNPTLHPHVPQCEILCTPSPQQMLRLHF